MSENDKNLKTKLDEYVFHTRDGKAFEIPADGSLGLLALGDLGTIAWRKKRMEVAKASNQFLKEE